MSFLLRTPTPRSAHLQKPHHKDLTHVHMRHTHILASSILGGGGGGRESDGSAGSCFAPFVAVFAPALTRTGELTISPASFSRARLAEDCSGEMGEGDAGRLTDEAVVGVDIFVG